MSKQVIIIGAGLGGLSLAQGLKKANIPFRIFERDASKDVRLQGYRLRINPDGAAALKTTLPEPTWKLFQDTCATTELGFTMLDATTGKIIQRKPGADRHRAGSRREEDEVYTADRTTLRDVLLTGLEDDVQFGKEFLRYETKDGKVIAHFVGGLTVEGDFLVGADGVYSRVRRQYLPSVNPIDTDGRAVYGKTPITPEFLERFNKDATEWMSVISGPNQISLFLELIKFPRDPAEVSSSLRSLKDYVYWVLISRSKNFLPDSELFSISSQQIAELSLKITENWDPSIRSLLELQQVEKTSAVRITSADANQKKWQSSNVTLLGDAIHCMPPTGGVGANTALSDAASLCELIKEGVEGISQYEEKMLGYAGQAIQRSMDVQKMFKINLLEASRPITYDR
jgi:2-polyprenyl-6-methoxyphenol hydroxylase-like FAD-dependent oxidoreductase